MKITEVLYNDNMKVLAAMNEKEITELSKSIETVQSILRPDTTALDACMHFGKLFVNLYVW